MNQQITELYDALTHAESLFGWRRPQATVHKKLDFSKSPALHAYINADINQLIQSLPLGLNATSRILDAGCGHGGTLAQLIKTYNCAGIGISLSTSQIKTARKLFPDPRASFLVKNYDEPPCGPFDLIITIESLIHATDLRQSYQALASRLTKRGYLLIIEDMFTPAAASSVNEPYFAPDALKQCWHLSTLYSENDHRNAAQQAGLELCTKAGLQTQDLSACVTFSAPQKLKRAIGIIRLITRYLPAGRLKTALKAAIGGYILEYYYARTLVNYKLMVFKSLCKD